MLHKQKKEDQYWLADWCGIPGVPRYLPNTSVQSCFLLDGETRMEGRRFGC